MDKLLNKTESDQIQIIQVIAGFILLDYFIPALQHNLNDLTNDGLLGWKQF